MSLTEKQKDLLRWIVERVRTKMLNEEEICFYWSHDGTGIVNYQGNDVPEVKTITLDTLEQYRYIKGQRIPSGAYNVALQQKAYEAVDSNFAEPDRSAIPHLIPLTEVEHLDSELWERVRISLSAGGDDPTAWDSAVRNATVVLEERLRQLGNIDNTNQKATGKDIVNLIFGSSKSVQKDKLSSEKLEGYRDLYSGIVKVFRNHYAHRLIDPKPEEGGEIIVFINLLLKMLDNLDWETKNENT